MITLDEDSLFPTSYNNKYKGSLTDLLSTLSTHKVNYTSNRNGLNVNLAHRQNITEEEFETLQVLHDIKAKILAELDVCPSSENNTYLNKLTQLEYALQDGWRLPRDSSKHYYSYLSKKCICAKEYDQRQFSAVVKPTHKKECPLHGIDIL